MRTALLVADHDDPHTESVRTQLRRAGCEAVVAGVWESWNSAISLSLNRSAAEYWVTTLRGQPQSDEEVDVGTVWWRTKPRVGRALTEADAFILRERKDFLTSLVLLKTPQNARINCPLLQERARLKPLQLSLAGRLGLDIPPTMLTSRSESIQAAAWDRFVYKPLTWLATLDGRFLFTSVVNNEDVRMHSKELEMAPAMFQPLIEKRCEYRVTVVDGEAFTARVFSQDRVDTRVDFRRNSEALRYESCELSDSLTTCLLRLTSELGLRFAAIDLIETQDGTVYFLEANPAGNWLWIESATGLRISEALASALLRTCVN
jgi:glutathione synthase/RimK-type ligase-like ATP-grasp enzyme